MSKILFVYGTLMQGMRNHQHLEKAAFVGPAETKPEYELLTNGSIPAIRSGNQAIKGELYEVDDEMLKSLDVLEEVDTNLYEKKEVEIGGKTATIYLGGERLFASDTWVPIPNGDYHSAQ